MGYIRHHAIIVTSFNEESINIAHEEATKIFQSSVTPIILSNVNGYFSFFIGPDGSKLGWAKDEKGDKNRGLFVEWMNNKCKEEDSFYLSYSEVAYGDEHGNFSEVITHN